MLALLLIGISAPSRSDGAPAPSQPWRLSEFMISVWGEPSDEAAAQAIADAGFNTAMSSADKLDLCEKHGLRSIVRDATPETAADLADHPAVWGLYVKDEPPAEEFAAVGERVVEFHSLAPGLPAYVNLMAWMDLSDYFAIVKPKFLSYDYYQWWWNRDHHFGRLAAHRAAALEHDVPLICWVEANADKRWEWGEAGATTLPDNEPKLRQSVYTSLAYGVKGIQWFNWTLVFQRGEGGVMLPNLKESGEHIKQINAELKALGPTLIGLTSTGVYHTAPVPEGCQPQPPEMWLQTDTTELAIGDFTDRSGRRHALVANRGIERARWVVLRAAPAVSIEVLDRSSGTWRGLAARRTTDASIIEFILAPGDGALLRGSAPSP